MNDIFMPTAFAPQAFNLVNSPLSGSALIEASAGTGKTYSLAFLYLRFILEGGYAVEEILVTTFTKAAVAELKERLFERLLDVDNKLNHPDTERKQADDLTDYLDDIIADIGLDKIKKRTQQAITQFDQAQIHTIDGFALQLYQENTLNIGSFPLDEVVNDNKAFIEKLFYRFASNGFANCQSPEKTAKVIAPLANQTAINTLTALINQLDNFQRSETPFTDSEVIKRQYNQLQTQLQKQPELLDNIRFTIDNAQINRQGYNHKKIGEIQELLNAELDDWVNDKKAVEKLAWLGATKLREKLKPEFSALADDYFYQQIDDLIASLPNYISQAQQDFHEVMLELAGLIKNELLAEQLNAATLSHHDITEHVSHGAQLGKVNHNFAVAMIDESQDTSPAQLALFKSLFIDTDKTCFFVGDPKQAIYGFRGADIYSYLAIRSEVTHHYILDTNYRSSLPLNQFVNRVFAKDNPKNHPFIESQIDYYQVNSKSQQSGLSAGNAIDIIQCSEFSTDALAKQCALQIAELLNSQLLLADNPVKPNDIAVLVRSDSQAKKVKSALATLGIPAAHKGKDSIYNSEESILFYWLLEAITSPRSSQIKRLLVSPLFNCSFEAMHDEALIGDYCQQFQRYQTAIDNDGFTVTLNRLMREQHIGYRLLNQAEGSRRLTNFLHIFETLQNAIHRSQTSIYSALQWLAERINQHEAVDELRLDDDNAVTIQTIHKSKGLEYSVVFLPFLGYQGRHIQRDTNIVQSNVLQQAAFVATASSKLKVQIEFEDAAENRRLTYVALTRAKYKNVLFLPTEKPKQEGDLLKLLSPDTGELLDSLVAENIAEIKAELEFEPSIHTRSQGYIERNGKISQRNANFNQQWLLDSFSGLTRYHQHDIRHYDDDGEAPKTQLLQFPKGAVPGTALHEVFEKYMAERTNLVEHLTQTLDKYLLRVDDSKQLADELTSVLHTALTPNSFALDDIAVDKQAIEMKFFLHLNSEQRQLLYQQMNISSAEVDSYLHGFIDLMFYHQGKYYILDYKSNFLGTKISDYNQENMAVAMQENAYNLQALIYTIAIDKHLTLTHPGYDYASHFGGVYYLFIRGMAGEKDNGQTNGQSYGIHHFIPDESLIAQFSGTNDE